MSEKTSILIVDDESDIVSMLSRHFRFRGYNVAEASNGVEALEYLKGHLVDVVISDVLMPRMDGIELLVAIRSEYPMVHVIVMTGYVTLDNLLAAMRQGADTCIFKPFQDLGELDEAVRDAEHQLGVWKQKLTELACMKGE